MTVTLSTKVRINGYKAGKGKWDGFHIYVSMFDAAGKKKNNAWKERLEFSVDQNWKTIRKTFVVPEDAVKLELKLSHTAGAGIIDLGTIDVMARQ